MNKLILGAAAVAFSISPAHAVEDYIENNIQFTTGNSSITFRKYTAGVDYNMVQLTPNLQAGVTRIAGQIVVEL